VVACFYWADVAGVFGELGDGPGQEGGSVNEAPRVSSIDQEVVYTLMCLVTLEDGREAFRVEYAMCFPVLGGGRDREGQYPPNTLPRWEDHLFILWRHREWREVDALPLYSEEGWTRFIMSALKNGREAWWTRGERVLQSGPEVARDFMNCAAHLSRSWGPWTWGHGGDGIPF